jgi:transcriptional regulator with XRE-family HTH domain
MSKFGESLKALRQKKSWTLREAQRRSGVSRQTILRAEAGEFITLDTMLKLFTIYDVTGSSKDSLMSKWVDESVVRQKGRNAMVIGAAKKREERASKAARTRRTKELARQDVSRANA